jgi:3-dehydroquinate synthase
VSRTRVEVATDPPYTVHVGPGLLGELRAAVEGTDGAALLVDARVAELHGAALAALADVPRLALPGGEGTKSLARLGEVLEFLARAGLSRASCLVAVGGGVIGDLGGLAASLFKRGCQVVQAPTTLLAQVDASVGGKTAVNLAAGKNLAGTFHQPRAVHADTRALATLHDDELRSGLGEVVKTALIGGEEQLARLEQRAEALLARDPDALAETVTDCVRVKARVVAADPLERGPRRALNLGHTFGHAIEHAVGYGALPHGVAVAAGLGLALRAARETGLADDPELEARTRALLARLGLPGSLTELGRSLDPAALRAGLLHDKKGHVGAPQFVLPRAAGALELGVTLDDALLERLLNPGVA